VTLKGQYIEKIEWLTYWPRKNHLKIYLLEILKKKSVFSAYIETMLNGEKVLKLSISQLIIEQHEKIFRSSLSTLERSDYAKKPTYATVSLTS
jgi:hypothetical protein